MDEQTALVLALQLVALFSIAGALLLYLLCKIRAGNEGGEATGNGPGGGKAILITCTDSAIGLQVLTFSCFLLFIFIFYSFTDRHASG